MPAQPAPDWRPSPADLEALSPRARARLALALEDFTFDALDGERLLDACRSLSRVELLEAALTAEGVTARESDRLLRALARESRVFLSLWANLNLPRRTDDHIPTIA